MNVMIAEFALIYVVIEGYKEIGRIFPALDRLLEDDNRVSKLRKFRNATFHYQRDPYTPKMMEFIADDEAVEWLQKVKSTLSLYFRIQVPNLLEPEEAVEMRNSFEGRT